MSDLLASFNLLKTAATALVAERDRQKVLSIQIDFMERLLDVQLKAMEIIGEVASQREVIDALRQEAAHFKASRTEKQRYRLCAMGGVGQFFAYTLRSPAELEERCDEAPHFVCQPCFDAGKKVVLIGNGSGFWECPVCKTGAQAEFSSSGFVGVGIKRTDLRGF